MSAFQAHAQVNPAVAGFHTILTDMFVSGGYADLVKVRTMFHPCILRPE